MLVCIFFFKREIEKNVQSNLGDVWCGFGQTNFYLISNSFFRFLLVFFLSTFSACRFSVDLASELRPSDCNELQDPIAILHKSAKHYLPIYKYYLHLKVTLQAFLRFLLSDPFFLLCLHQALIHKAIGASDAVCLVMFVFFCWSSRIGRSAGLQASRSLWCSHWNSLAVISFYDCCLKKKKTKTFKLKASGLPHSYQQISFASLILVFPPDLLRCKETWTVAQLQWEIRYNFRSLEPHIQLCS